MKDKLKIALLAGNTKRASAYASILENLSLKEIEIMGLFYGFKSNRSSNVILDDITRSYFEKEKLFIPNLNKSVKKIFKENNWKFFEFIDSNVNSKILLKKLKEINVDIIVFAGYPGQILGSEHFENTVRYLHMHPGELPKERGSTTLYYSILDNRDLSVTAFYMSEKIDDGENILCKKYPLPTKKLSIDIWLDNVIRADCFKSAVKSILTNQNVYNRIEKEFEDYYIIHPVLKHIALLSFEQEKLNN